ncbi:MAG: hypothetical protein K5886_01860 [Lachnospiraceae bacterium]|nr:hypothetical protein [Lachnospiraceae bacterium]
MGEQDKRAVTEALQPEKRLKNTFRFTDTDQDLMNFHRGRDMINMAVAAVLFAGYSLTFLVPKFYGATDKYVGVFVFFCCMVLFFNNLNLRQIIRKKDREFIFVSALLTLCLVNLIIVRSGFGAFFVASDFILIFYLSAYISFNEKYLYIMAGLYMLLLLYWFVIAYPKLFSDFAYYGYNTNTAATFTIYTLLCALLLLELLKEKKPAGILRKYPEIPGFFMTLLLIKGLQLSFWHRARGAFVMLIMFLLFKFVLKKTLWYRKGFYKAVWVFATLGSLLFVALYILVSFTGVNFKLPFFYKSVFSGRELIWREFFELFVKKPLTGIGTNAVIESFFEFNVHNAMYNFLVIHGIVVFAGILILVFKRAGYFYGIIRRSGISLCALIVLLSVFIESFFDVDLIWADYSLNLLFLLIFINSGKAENGEV